MKKLALSVLLMSAAAGAAFGQQWEFGVNGGGSFLNSIPVASSAGAATTGFQTGGAFGVFMAQNLYKHVSGELRYSYITGDLVIHSGGAIATFAGVSHAVHYDLLLHTIGGPTRPQFFVAFGGGVKVYQGVGTEAAYQPLMQFAYLTKTRQNEPLASLGGGVKWRVASKVLVRAEFRDYVTPFPTNVITPAFGATFKGNWLHNIVPMAGVSYMF